MNNKLKENFKKITSNKYFSVAFQFLGLILITLLFGIATGMRSMSFRNISLILDQSFVLLICSSGVFFVMTMGGMDFSQGSIVGVASIVVATLAKYNIILAIVAGIATGAIIGALNGFLNVKMKIASFIVTICTMFIFRGLCAFLTTNAPASAPIELLALNTFGVKIPIVLFVLIAAYFFFTKTSFGKRVKSIGAGETAARFTGVRVEKTKFLMFVVAGALAGLAAFFNTMRVGSITATSGALLETNIMIALVLGGLPVSGGAKCKFISVITGCLIFSVLNNGLVMLQVEPSVQQLIRGVIFMILVIITIDRKSSVVIK